MELLNDSPMCLWVVRFLQADENVSGSIKMLHNDQFKNRVFQRKEKVFSELCVTGISYCLIPHSRL